MDHLRILLVEDSDADAFLLCEQLHEIPRLDIHVERVTTLRDALSALEKVHPDVILYDLSLPDARGLSGFRQLADRAQHLPTTACWDHRAPRTLDELLAAADREMYRRKPTLPPTDRSGSEASGVA